MARSVALFYEVILLRLRNLFVPISVLALSAAAFGQNFTTPSVLPLQYGAKMTPVIPFLRDYASYSLQTKQLKAFLEALPVQRFPGDRADARQIEIPMPDNTTRRFKIVEAPIMSPELQRQSSVHTYAGNGFDNPAETIRLDFGPNGFHGYIYSPDGDVVIEPVAVGDQSRIISYFRRDNLETRVWSCGTKADSSEVLGRIRINPVASNLKTYKLAMNSDFEYFQFWGSNLTTAQNGVVTSINRVVGVYEKDFAISMTLVSNVVWTTSADPYTNNNGSTMLGQNQTTTDSQAAANGFTYDIGHVFSTGGGGIAGLRVVGVAGQKARGVTGGPTPTGPDYDIDYVAHEMGHQFGGNHTFNSVSLNCSGNRVASAAYETGSGTTIMAYAGICSPEDVQPHSDAYFHVKSYDEIISWRNNAGSGGVQTGLANTAPTVNAGSDYVIPLNTPYRLTASGNDVDGNALTYCWEEYDLGASTPPYNAASSPMVRSKNPLVSPTRFIPALPTVLAGSTDVWERLPSVGRVSQWRVTARDNVSGGGGSANDQAQVTMSAAGSNFAVTAPTAGVTWQGNSSQTVTWNVGGTTGAPINTANVNILLSVNGGSSYGTGTATIVLANTPNDGSETITVPNLPTGTARIIVEGAGNIFYNVSPNFTITAGPTTFIVPPATFSLFRGVQTLGNVASLANSDDDRLNVRPGNTVSTAEAPIQIIVEATSPVSSASSMKFKVESATSVSNIGQTISLFDWTTGTYESFGVTPVPLTDGVVEVTATNPNRFIQAGTNLMRARVAGKQTGPVVTFPYALRTDQIIWTITN